MDARDWWHICSTMVCPAGYFCLKRFRFRYPFLSFDPMLHCHKKEAPCLVVQSHNSCFWKCGLFTQFQRNIIDSSAGIRILSNMFIISGRMEPEIELSSCMHMVYGSVVKMEVSKPVKLRYWLVYIPSLAYCWAQAVKELIQEMLGVYPLRQSWEKLVKVGLAFG